MDWIYPVSYLASLSGLVLWFLTQGNKKLSHRMSVLFLFGYLVYLTALAFSSGTLPYKLLVLVRDMVVMGIVVQLFNVLRTHVLASIALAVVAGLIVFFSYFNTLDFTFPQLDTKTLDTSAEFLVRIDAEDAGVIDVIRKRFPCTVERAFTPQAVSETDLDDYYIVDVQSDQKRMLKRVYDWLFSSNRIEWVEPNEVMELSLPDAVEAQSQSLAKPFLNDPDITRQWGFEPLGANALHEKLSGSGVQPVKIAKVAIIDTGVDAMHEDLQENYVSISNAYDTDPRGHGTHCAGIAAAVSNNRVGIASLSPGTGYVQVTSVRAISASGAGTQKSVIDAMIKAVDSGADVLSLSLGGFSTQSKQRAYEEAVQYAADQNAIVVVAAGNNSTNAKKISPANVRGVIAVSAIDQKNQKATFSNSVQDLKWAVAAPGVDVYSTLPQNAYGNLSGTSMATPYVSGLIGLLKSFRPDLDAKEAYEILHSTGKDTKSGKDTGVLIQPLRAVGQVID